MRPFFSPSLFITLAFLVACEGNTDRTWRVTNNASSAIQVKTTNVAASFENVTSIAIGSTETVGTSTQLGGNGSEQLPQEMFSDFLIINVAGDTMQTSYIDPGSWTSEIEQIKKVPSQYEHTYTFVVEDSDF